MADIKPTGITLGTVIAFVAPGFIALRAAAYHVPTAKDWIDAAIAKEQGLGVFFFVMLASLSLGIVVSGVRSLLLDALFHGGAFGLQAIPRGRLRFSHLSDEHRRAVFEGIVENYYKYYQFYSNTFIALLLLIVAHETAPAAAIWSAPLYIIFVFSLFGLFFAARSSLLQYAVAVDHLFEDKEQTHDQRLATTKAKEGDQEILQEGKAGPETEEEGHEGP